MKKEYKVAACVTTYNRKEKLVNCINALLAQDYKNLDIYVIDNASTDHTKEKIKTYIDCSQIKYINTGSNLGGAGGFNFAIKYVINTCDLIWIMDDDTYPKPNALTVLLQHIPNKDLRFGFLSSLVEWSDGSACLMNKQFLQDDIFNDMNALKAGMIPVKTASFVSLLISSTIVREVGLPIKEFFLWGDDAEYTKRLCKYGGYLVPESIVTHDMGANDGIDIVKNSYERTKRYNLFVRNRIYIAKREKNTKEVLKGYLSAFKQVFRVILFAKDHKVERVKIINKGIIESFRFNPSIEYVE